MDNLGIGDLAAILAAAGVTIYVLGLIGLAIPISRTFTEDLTTAWYAVSLLPRTIVAGQGVRIWLRWPLLITAAVLLLTTTSLAVRTAATALLVLGFGIYALAQVVRAVYERKRGWIGITISWILAWAGAGNISLLFLAGNIPLVSNIFYIFAASFLIGLPMAIGTYPPLPKVAITKQAGATTDEDLNPTKGHLVAHSDGFWYLFDQHNDLLSIPDDQVLAVRTSRKAHMPPVGTEPPSKGTEGQEEAKQEEEEVR